MSALTTTQPTAAPGRLSSEPFPGDQRIVIRGVDPDLYNRLDAAIGEGEGSQFDNIDQLARLDDFPVIGRIERVSTPFLRKGAGRIINQGKLGFCAIQR